MWTEKNSPASSDIRKLWCALVPRLGRFRLLRRDSRYVVETLHSEVDLGVDQTDALRKIEELWPLQRESEPVKRGSRGKAAETLALVTNEWQTTSQLAARSNMALATIRARLQRLVRDGCVQHHVRTGIWGPKSRWRLAESREGEKGDRE